MERIIEEVSHPTLTCNGDCGRKTGHPGEEWLQLEMIVHAEEPYRVTLNFCPYCQTHIEDFFEIVSEGRATVGVA